ncbi:MAG TPA: plastocyanin/azurin family copper-binding protein [Gemmatimonadaceae bacterium]|nr:plastocyanin/azurin family copper-binding protein [Gemmatimonadaceae bacterium]
MLAAALVSGGCSDDDYSSNPQGCTPGASQVCMTATTFNPTTITVSAGTTVQWVNTSGVTHTVTSASGSAVSFDQQVTSGSAGFSHQFSTAGTFQYFCKLHAGMNGTVVVN